jgi:ABC transporter family protein
MSGTPHHQGREPLLAAEQVRKVYRTGEIEVEALVGLELAVHRGELVAVMGPSGSGKTTLLSGRPDPTGSISTPLKMNIGAQGEPARLDAAILGVTVALGFLAMGVPTRFALRSHPVDAIGLRERAPMGARTSGRSHWS